jgi:20S proteasome alpha/beta subunit
LGSSTVVSAACCVDLQQVSGHEGKQRLPRMTVVVAFYCSDGVVVAADSMITPNVGGLSVGHHHGQKISILPGPQIFALAGDIGQNARVRMIAESNHTAIARTNHPIDFPLQLSQTVIQQFTATGINKSIDASPVLAYGHGGQHQCCVFEGAFQPRLLDEYHYYSAHGSGKLSADPFLRFLTDVFCPNGRPTIREGIFLAAWTVQHVIDVNPGGVAGPVRIATLEKDASGAFVARSLDTNEIDEHLQAIESAAAALRKWRDELQSGHAADDAPEPPTPPDQPDATQLVRQIPSP